MTAYRGPLERIDPDGLDILEATGAWMAEEKFDGEWVCLHVRDGMIHEAESRQGLELDSAWWVIDTRLGLGPDSPWSGGHCLHGESMPDATIRLWDASVIAGEDLRARPIEYRRHLLEGLHAALPAWARAELLLAPRWMSDFRARYDEVMARGGEGLVVKRRGSSLETRRADGKCLHWVKVKRGRD